MAVVARYVLGTTEKKSYSLDYSAWLSASETIASATAVTTQVTTPPLVPTSPSTSGSVVTFFVSGGDGATTYSIVVTITTSIGEIKADSITFSSTVIS
jgi:hypothetical protein